jgi:hypothetical protein
MEMSTESFVESALRVAERFGVPLVLLAVVIWFMRDAAITLHGTVLVPIVKSHTEFLDSTRETLDEMEDQQIAGARLHRDGIGIIGIGHAGKARLMHRAGHHRDASGPGMQREDPHRR